MEVSEEEVEQLLELAWWGRREQRWVEVTDLGGVHRAFMQAYGNPGCRRRALTALKMVMTDTLRRLSRQRGGTDAVHIEAQAEENLSRLGNNQTGDFATIHMMQSILTVCFIMLSSYRAHHPEANPFLCFIIAASIAMRWIQGFEKMSRVVIAMVGMFFNREMRISESSNNAIQKPKDEVHHRLREKVVVPRYKYMEWIESFALDDKCKHTTAESITISEAVTLLANKKSSEVCENMIDSYPTLDSIEIILDMLSIHRDYVRGAVKQMIVDEHDVLTCSATNEKEDISNDEISKNFSDDGRLSDSFGGIQAEFLKLIGTLSTGLSGSTRIL